MFDLDFDIDYGLSVDSKTGVTKREHSQITKYKKLLKKSIKTVDDLCKVKLKDKYQLRIVTSRNFNGLSLMEWILTDKKFTEIYIAIYRMNLGAVDYIINFFKSNPDCDGKIILSSFFRENKKYEKWCRKLDDCNLDNLEVTYAYNHAKVFLGKTTDGLCYVMEGSGNLSDNARIEQYLIEINEDTYLMHKEWMDEING